MHLSLNQKLGSSISPTLGKNLDSDPDCVTDWPLEYAQSVPQLPDFTPFRFLLNICVWLIFHSLMHSELVNL